MKDKIDYTGELFLDKLFKDLYKSKEVLNGAKKIENIKSPRDNDRILLKNKFVIKESDIPESYYDHQQEILLERGYGHVPLTNEQKKEVIGEQKKSLDYTGELFLDKSFKDLYRSKEVLNGARDKSQKAKNIRRYMERLEELHQRVNESPRDNDRNLLKKLYYDKYVIKTSDIPESYYKHQQEILLERGYGHVSLTNEQKKELAKQVIEEQKKSLDYWIDYFTSRDTSMYPMWAKYWAFQGMLKLGSYDKESRSFRRRTKGTTAPFIELNQEALALSIDMLLKYLNREELNDKDLEKIIESGVFGKIYAYNLIYLDKQEKEKGNTNAGIWIKYPKGSDHMKLVKSIQGKGTGWCTAGEDIAKNQLSHGDFYVYYSYDKNNQPTIPRIAIRMEYDKIAEIRGVAANQNIEPEMENIVSKKLEEFPDKDKYKKKVQDMQQLTKIYKECQSRELTTEELIFLYEMNGKIKGFGNAKDPRIEEILSRRNKIKDLSNIFSYQKKIGGTLDLSSLTSAEGLVLPKEIGINLYLSGLTSAKGLVLPEKIGGDLYLSGLTSAEGLVLPEKIGGTLHLSDLTSAKGLVLPKEIGKDLYLEGLTNAEGLTLPEKIGRYLDLSGLKNAEGLVLPEKIDGNLFLNGLKSTEGLVLPKEIGGCLRLKGLTSVEGLILPEKIGGDLDLYRLESFERLVLPKEIGGCLCLNGLTSAEGLILPEKIGEHLILENLKSAKGLILPKEIGGFLYLKGLTSAEGLVLPEKVNGKIYLNDLVREELENRTSNFKR